MKKSIILFLMFALCGLTNCELANVDVPATGTRITATVKDFRTNKIVEGAVVELYLNSTNICGGNRVASKSSDKNGNAAFGSLQASSTYTIKATLGSMTSDCVFRRLAKDQDHPITLSVR